MKRTWRRWTEEENNVLKYNYPRIGCVETTKLLPNDRDWDAVRRQANKLGLISGAKRRKKKCLATRL